MGFTTAAIGLCGVVFSQINDFLFGDEEYENAPVENDSTYNFLMFLAIVMSVGLFIGSFFLGPVLEPKKVDEEQDENTPLLAKGTGSEVEGISGLDFLLHPIGFALFSTLFLVLGIGYVYLANIGQILLALSPEATQHVRNFHITVFSLGNCGSRAFFGALSDLLRNKFGIHRLWIFLFAVIGMIVTLVYFLAAVNDANDLLPCTLAVSMSYGIVFGIAPAATTEFGTEVMR
jgi:hypothetical protein